MLYSLDNTIPLLKDLYQYITPRYAADWKVIGVLLDLPSGELKAIEAGYPTNVKWCCNQMLEKWLEVDTTASWRKLFAIIESPAVSSCSAPDKGDYSFVSGYHEHTYNHGIFTVVHVISSFSANLQNGPVDQY